jgi:hypothetical protein
MRITSKKSVKPRKTMNRPRSPKISRASVMSLYRSHVARLRAAQKPVTVSQTTTIIGTDNSWFNAQTINRDPAWVRLNNASYVWSARNLSSDNAIISRRFTISRNVLSARLTLSVDNYAVVFVNGRNVLFDSPQDNPAFFTSVRRFNIRPFLRRGTNDIVIIAFNFSGPRSSTNPAGVAARLNIRLS